jgi:hypothetical protein
MTVQTAPMDRATQARLVDAHEITAEHVFGEPATFADTRQLARHLALLLTSDDDRWTAYSVERRYGRIDGIEYIYQQVIIIEPCYLIVVTSEDPPGDRHCGRISITLNGVPVSHRLYTGTLPWKSEAVIESLRRHTQLTDNGHCDGLGCTRTPLYATHLGSWCATCLDR